MIDLMKLTEDEQVQVLTDDELDTVAGGVGGEVLPHLGRGYQF